LKIGPLNTDLLSMLWCVAVAETAIQSGMSPEFVAGRILEAVCTRDSEVLIGPLLYRVAVYLRNFLPNVYFSVMRRRAWRESVSHSKTS